MNLRKLFYHDAAFHVAFNDRFPGVQLFIYQDQDDLFYHLGLDLVNAIRDNPEHEVWVYHGSTLRDFSDALNLSDFHLNAQFKAELAQCGVVFDGEKYGVCGPTIGNLATHKSHSNSKQSRDNSNSIATVLNNKIHRAETETLQIRAQAYFPVMDITGVDMEMVMLYFRNFPIYKRLFSTSVFPHTLLFSLGAIDQSDNFGPFSVSSYKYDVLNSDEQACLKESGADVRIFGSFFKCSNDEPYKIRKDIQPLSKNNPVLRSLHDRYLGIEIEEAAKVAKNHLLTDQGLGNVCIIRDRVGFDCSHKIRSLMAALSLQLKEGPIINSVYLTRKSYMELAKWFAD